MFSPKWRSGLPISASFAFSVLVLGFFGDFEFSSEKSESLFVFESGTSEDDCFLDGCEQLSYCTLVVPAVCLYFCSKPEAMNIME